MHDGMLVYQFGPLHVENSTNSLKYTIYFVGYFKLL